MILSSAFPVLLSWRQRLHQESAERVLPSDLHSRLNFDVSPIGTSRIGLIVDANFARGRKARHYNAGAPAQFAFGFFGFAMALR